jgi:hypothetical protein
MKKVFKHLMVEEVAVRSLKEHLQIARYQGQWTQANSLKRQAEALTGVPEYMMRQFDAAIERIEAKLIELHGMPPEEDAAETESAVDEPTHPERAGGGADA